MDELSREKYERLVSVLYFELKYSIMVYENTLEEIEAKEDSLVAIESDIKNALTKIKVETGVELPFPELLKKG